MQRSSEISKTNNKLLQAYAGFMKRKYGEIHVVDVN